MDYELYLNQTKLIDMSFIDKQCTYKAFVRFKSMENFEEKWSLQPTVYTDDREKLSAVRIGYIHKNSLLGEF